MIQKDRHSRRRRFLYRVRINNKPMKNRRVVITGVGALTPIGNNLNDYWKNLINGKSATLPITRFKKILKLGL